MTDNIQLCTTEKCTGCKACGDICPIKCITFKEDSEGFYTPDINRDVCIKCGRCMKTCPVITPPTDTNTHNPKTYHAYSLNQQTVKSSSSGGIFVELAKSIISQGGIVCGVTQIKGSLKSVNIAIDKFDDIQLLQGSKYVQSDASNIYSTAIKALTNGQKVLFSGTPCQIAGMKNAVGKNKENLFLVEVICHGVPSYRFFKRYLNQVSNLSPSYFEFKNNAIWDYDTIMYDNRNRKHILIAKKDFYMKAFLSEEIFQNACYSCPFAKLPRQADITLGDYWGIENYEPHNSINKSGNSVILINNEKGMSLLNAIESACYISEVELKNVVKRNHNIYEPSKYKPQRATIYSDMDRLSLSDMAKKYNHRFTIRNYLGFLKRRIKEIFI